MTDKVRRALGQIEEVLISGGQDAQDLWAILSALRGPDAILGLKGERSFTEHDVKMGTTVYIRQAAFPLLAERQRTFVVEVPAILNPEPRTPFKGQSLVLGHNSHFYAHIRDAKDALDR